MTLYPGALDGEPTVRPFSRPHLVRQRQRAVEAKNPRALEQPQDAAGWLAAMPAHRAELSVIRTRRFGRRQTSTIQMNALHLSAHGCFRVYAVKALLSLYCYKRPPPTPFGKFISCK
ncbi:hypothetical protein Trisim1_001140 [Trichoderma cf. simile WF8]